MLRKADLERRLGLHDPQIDRLLNPRRASRLDQIEATMPLGVFAKVLRVDPRRGF